MSGTLLGLEYTYRQTHSYKEFLAQQYLKNNIDVVISRNTRELIGSIDEIYSNAACSVSKEVLQIGSDLEKKFDIVTFNLEAIAESLDVLNGNLVNGFQALFVRLDEVNHTLVNLSRGIDELVHIAKTPTQTWALNQYEIALDVTRRGFFPEALEAVTLAISGNNFNTGYKYDYRFHCLLGTLFLGIPGRPESIEVVDLDRSESAFSDAARYAQRDNPYAAALAHVGAGKATYAAGRLKDAERHMDDALKVDDKCGEANYQKSRLRLSANDDKKVRLYLEKALDIHWSFGIRAAEDEVFRGHEHVVEQCTRNVSQRIAQSITPPVGELKRITNAIKQMQESAFDVLRVENYRYAISDINNLSNLIDNGKLKGLHEARQKLEETAEIAKEAAANYHDWLSQNDEMIINSGKRDISAIKAFDLEMDAFGPIAFFLSIPIGITGLFNAGFGGLLGYLVPFHVIYWGVLIALQQTGKANILQFRNENDYIIRRNRVRLNEKLEKLRDLQVDNRPVAKVGMISIPARLG